MPTEGATHISDFNATKPDPAEAGNLTDDYLREIKDVLLTDFGNISGAVTADHTELNYLAGVTPGTALASLALVVDENKDLDLDGGDLTCTDLTVEGDIALSTAGSVQIDMTLSSSIYQNQILSALSNLTFWSGAYYSGSDLYRRTSDGATKIACATGSQDGAITLLCAEANTGSPDDAVDWTTGPGLRIQASADKPAMFNVASDAWETIASEDYVDAKGETQTDPTGSGTLAAGSVEVYVSTAYTSVSQGSALAAKSHGLSGIPQEVYAYAKCTTAEYNYSVDDVVQVDAWTHGNSGQGTANVTTWANATQVGGYLGSDGLQTRNKTTGALASLTESRWSIYIVAKYYS